VIRFEWPGSRQQLAILALIALVVTAGCAGLGSPDETNNETEDADDPTDPGESGPSDNNGTGEANVTESALFGDVEPVEGEVTAEEILDGSADALVTADSYRMAEQTTSLANQNNQELTIEIERDFRVDRPNQQLAVDVRTETRGRTVENEQYLENGTLYQRSAQIAQRYGTEWLRTNVSESFDQQFRQLDQAARIQQLLGNATATLAGQTQFDGQQAYALTATVNTTTVTEVRPTVVETEETKLSLWVSTETLNPLRIVENSTLTEVAPQGDLPQELDRTFTYSYEDVDIRLPEPAKDAPFSSEVAG